MAKTILVFSGKGGVGKSSVTVGLASSLTRLGKKVLCIDADIGLRSLDLIMNIGATVVYNWLDIIEERCAAFKAVVTPKNSSSASLLSAPLSYSESITQESFGNMLKKFDSEFDYIFIDSPAGVDEFHNMLACVCESALLVVTPDSVSLRSAEVAARKALSANPSLEIRVVVNRFCKQEVLDSKQINIDDIIDQTHSRLIGVIPEDDSIRLLSQGEKPVKYALDAFMRVAKRVCGESVPFNPKDFY